MENNNPSIEKMVIANLWTNYDKLDISIVNPNWFTDNRYRSIWVDSLKWISEKGDKDPVSFDHLHKYNVTQIIIDCHNFCVIPEHFEEHVKLLNQQADKTFVHCLLANATDSYISDTDTTIKMVCSWVDDYRKKQIYTVSNFTPKDTAIEFIEDMDRRKNMGNTPEISLGDRFKVLDSKIWGFGRGEFIVLGGDTGLGKSILTLNFAEAMIKNGKKVLYFSTEMKSSEILARYFSISQKMPHWKFRRNYLDDNERKLCFDALEKFQKEELFHIADIPSPTIENIFAITKIKKPDIVFVDHLQECEVGKADNHSLAVGEFARQLKNLARTEDIPVLAVSQFSRGNGQSMLRKPTIHDLKESSGIEQQADGIGLMSLDTKAYMNDDFKIIDLEWAKNRSGWTGWRKIEFNKTYLIMEEKIDFE